MNNYIGYYDNKRMLFFGLVLYLFLVIFTPYIKIGNRDNFEITFIITLFFAFFIPVIFKKIRRPENRMLNTILMIMLLIFILDTVSILNYITVSKGMDNIVANIIPNIKIALYVLIIVGFYNLKLDEYGHSLFLYGIMPVIACAAGLVGVFQRFNILNFNDWFTKYYISSYSGDVQIEIFKESHQWFRVVGTLSNPNFYSLELIIFMVFIVSNIIFRNSTRIKVVNILIGAILFMTLIFSQSRTALIALVCIFFYIMLIQAVKGGTKNILKYLVVTIGIIILSLLLIKYLNLNYLFEAIKEGISTRSVTQRIDRWNEAIKLFKLHPIVGIGPVIGTYFPAVDNEYFHLLRNYGIIGLLGHLAFYIFVFFISFKDMFARNKSPLVQQYAFAVNCSILAVLISNITLATFYHWRNFVLLLFVCCMWIRARSVLNE